jgi:hypothetical protein
MLAGALECLARWFVRLAPEILGRQVDDHRLAFAAFARRARSGLIVVV